MFVSDFLTHAYGKIILLGEHAVVYGYPGLAVGIANGVSCHVTKTPTHEFQFYVPEWDKKILPQSLLGMAFQKILAVLPSKQAGCHVEFRLSIPAGAGMGSSAAICVSLIRTLLAWQGLVWPLERINELALEAEKICHGSPSGIDNTIATFGGFCFVADSRFSCPWQYFQTLPLGKNIAYLLPGLSVPISLVVVNTNCERQTKAMVEKVKNFSTEKPDAFSSIMESIHNLTLQGYECLLQQEYEKFGQCLDQNHQCLQKLGVSCSQLDQAWEAAKKAGAKGAKLTGAGGGGCLIAFSPGKEADVVESCKKLGFSSFVLEVGKTALC